MTRSRHTSTATFPVPTLRPGDVVEIECTDLIAKTGQAVGRADGMVVYVLGPIPGERARVRIDQNIFAVLMPAFNHIDSLDAYRSFREEDEDRWLNVSEGVFKPTVG